MTESELAYQVEKYLKKLTLRQKTALCQGVDGLSIGNLPEAGIGQFNMHDGPQGVRLEDGRKATALPCGMALSCTFDTAASQQYGELIGRECNTLNIHSILGPGFNLMRTPLNGRNFEYYGEDPVLSGKIAAGYIRGTQKHQVASTPKHLALNNQEICRTIGSSNIDERTLQELYLRSFEIATTEGHPWMMMSSYNKINGEPASQCGHVQDELAKRQWGFDGVMVSDWGGAHDTVGCANGGLDLEMGSQEFFGDALYQAVQKGEVTESTVDDKARRILRLMLRTGVIGPEKISAGEINTPHHHNLVRELAEQGMVLLKNTANFLPFDRSKLKKLAVIGPSANFQHHAGGLENCGGSGAVHPEYEITPLAGLREYLGDQVEILYTPGVKFQSERLIPEQLFPQGLRLEIFEDNKNYPTAPSQPFQTMTIASPNLAWGQFLAAGVQDDDPLSHRVFSLRLTGVLVPQKTEKVQILLNTARFIGRLYLNDQLISETECGGFATNSVPEIELTAGQPLQFRLEARRTITEFSEIKVLWHNADTTEIEHAVELARQADAVVFVGGTTHRYDREAIGWGDVPDADIPSLDLPDGQYELLQQLIAVNPRLVVALINGSVLNVEPFIDQIPALLECWYPGMESGRALARVLFGEAEPGGRLNCTWARQLNDYACHANGSYPGVRGEDNPHVEYPEGIFIGYRHFEKHGIKPRFPFGYGLGYTTMQLKLSEVKILENNLAQQQTRVQVTGTVTNTGKRSGAAVVQLYVGDTVCSVERPVKELKNFAKYQLSPGETQKVEFILTYRDFAFFSEQLHQFTVEPGGFVVSLGLSSAAIAGSCSITL